MEWKDAKCGGETYRVCQQDHKTEALMCAKACILMAIQKLLGDEITELPFKVLANSAAGDVLYLISEKTKGLGAEGGDKSDLATAFDGNKVFILNYQNPKKKLGHYVIAEKGRQGKIVICDPWDGDAYETAKYTTYKGKAELAPNGIIKVTKKEVAKV